MAVKTFELQDSSSNIYYPHTRSDVVFLEDGITKLSTSLLEGLNILTPTTGSTANAILLNIPTLTNNKKYSFKATSVSTGNVTINEKTLKKSDGTQIGSGGIKANKVYDFYYDSTNDCVFILAKAEGDATDPNVLAGKYYSNSDDTNRLGTMPNNGALNGTLPINGTYTIPLGYTTGGTVTQNIATKTSQTYTPTTTNQTISSNQYLTGIQTILGDANLISQYIVNGISIFGVAGSATGLKSASGTAVPTTTLTNGTYYSTINISSSFPFTPIAICGNGTNMGTAISFMYVKQNTSLYFGYYTVSGTVHTPHLYSSSGELTTTVTILSSGANLSPSTINWIAYGY